MDAPTTKIAEGNAKGELDWCEYRGKQLPGPGQYYNMSKTSTDPKDWKPKTGLPEYCLPKGGKLPPCGMNVTKSKSYIEWEEYRAKQIPGESSSCCSYILYSYAT